MATHEQPQRKKIRKTNTQQNNSTIKGFETDWYRKKGPFSSTRSIMSFKHQRPQCPKIMKGRFPNLEHRIPKCSHDTYQTWVPETSVSDSAGLPHKTPQEQILSTGNTLNSRKALITDGQITNKQAKYGLGNTWASWSLFQKGGNVADYCVLPWQWFWRILTALPSRVCQSRWHVG